MRKVIIFHFFIYLSLLNFSKNLYAQVGDVKVIPPTPEAASLGKFGSVPMGSYTGAASFSIPLYTVKGKNLEVPVTLNYSSNGIRVEDIAPWTGHGWTLNAGGIINRTVLDLADETRNFNILPNIETNTLTQPDCAKIENTLYDLQYDEFTFDFMGNHGKFIIVNQKAQIIEALDDYKIEIVCSQPITSTYTTVVLEMIITDKNGIQYYFGKSYGSYPDPQETAIINGQGSPVTSWYLTKMVHWSGDTIEFEYQQENQSQYQRNFGETAILELGSDCPSCPPANNQNQYTNYTYYHDLYRPVVFHLMTVRATNGYNFDYVNIDRVSRLITGKNKKIQLTKANDLLTRVEFKSTSGVVENKYEFEYDHQDVSIPRNTKSKDFWGYYNGQDNTAVDKGFLRGNHNPYPEFAVYRMLTRIIYPTAGVTTIEYEGNSKLNDGNLQYFGGVRVKKTSSIGFSEPHDDIETTYDYNDSGEFTTPNRYTTEYSSIVCEITNGSGYTTVGSSIPFHCTKIRQNSNGYFNAYSSIEGSVFYNMVSEKRIANDGKKYEVVHYYNSAPMKITGGPILTCNMTNVNPTHFYGTANEYKTEYYDFLYDTVTILGETYNVISGKRLQRRELLNYENNYSLNGSTYFSYLRERKENGPILSDLLPQNGLYYALPQFTTTLSVRYNISKYQVTPFWRQLKSKTTENYFYDSSNNQTSVVETTNYNYTNETYVDLASYMPIHHQVVEEVKTNSSNSVISRDILRYRYPNDLGTTPYGGGLETYQSQANTALKRENQHRIGTPVQIEASREEGNYNFNNDFVPTFSGRLYTQRTTYKNFGTAETNPNLVLPEFVKYSKGQLLTGEVLENKLKYLRYTLATGRVLEAQKENGTTICYLYDNTKKNVIAMIENATFSQIATQLGITTAELENIAPIGYTPIASIEGLRATLGNAMITTYTYNSNDQITSITDPKGDKVSYQYDVFKRLIRIIDKNGNVLTENEYHYKQ